MSRKATKAVGNVYFQARMRAAEYNKAFATRAGASEVVQGVTEDCIKKYELDLVRPPNDAVAMMADAYNAPELISWYCANECPLGRNCRAIDDDMTPERSIVRMKNALDDFEEAIDTFSEIFDDGEVDGAETQALREVEEKFLEKFFEMKLSINEALAMCQRGKR